MLTPRCAALANRSRPARRSGARTTILCAGFSANAAASIARKTGGDGDRPVRPASTRAMPSPDGSSLLPHHDPPSRRDTSSRRAAAARSRSSGVCQFRLASTRVGDRMSAGEPGPLIATAVTLSTAAAPLRHGGARNRPSPKTIAGAPSAAARAWLRFCCREPAQAAIPASAPASAKSANSAADAAMSSGQPAQTSSRPAPAAAAIRAARSGEETGGAVAKSGSGMSANDLSAREMARTLPRQSRRRAPPCPRKTCRRRRGGDDNGASGGLIGAPESRGAQILRRRRYYRFRS